MDALAQHVDQAERHTYKHRVGEVPWAAAVADPWHWASDWLIIGVVPMNGNLGMERLQRQLEARQEDGKASQIGLVVSCEVDEGGDNNDQLSELDSLWRAASTHVTGHRHVMANASHDVDQIRAAIQECKTRNQVAFVHAKDEANWVVQACLRSQATSPDQVESIASSSRRYCLSGKPSHPHSNVDFVIDNVIAERVDPLQRVAVRVTMTTDSRTSLSDGGDGELDEDTTTEINGLSWRPMCNQGHHMDVRNAVCRRCDVCASTSSDSYAECTRCDYQVCRLCYDPPSDCRPVSSRRTLMRECGHTACQMDPHIVTKKELMERNSDMRLPLHCAAEVGACNVVEIWCEKIGSSAVEDIFGLDESPLYLAALNGHDAVVMTLARKWPELVSRRTLSGPLFAAVRNGHIDVVREILNRQPDLIQDLTADGKKAIHLAAEGGNAKLVALLAEMCPKSVGETCNNDSTPLMFAASRGHADTVEVLLRIGSIRSDDIKIAFDLASRNGHEHVKHILEARLKCSHNSNIEEEAQAARCFDVSRGDETTTPRFISNKLPFFVVAGILLVASLLVFVGLISPTTSSAHAFQESNTDRSTHPVMAETTSLHDGDQTVVSDVMEDEESKCSSAMYHAVQNGDPNMVASLAPGWGDKVKKRERGAMVPVKYAVCSGNLEVVETLLKQDPGAVRYVDSKGITEIYRAAESGNAKIVAMLAQQWPEGVRMRAKTGLDPLGIAALNGHLEAVKVLLNIAPDAVRDVDSLNGATVVHAAARGGRADVVAVLSERWPEGVRMAAKDGFTASLIAASNGHVKAVQELLKAVPESVRDVDFNGATPMYLAAQNGHADVVELLLAVWPEGVSKPARANGIHPLSTAVQWGHLDVVKKILKVAPNAAQDVNSDSTTAIFRAAREGHADVVAELAVAWPEGVMKPIAEGFSPFAVASLRGRLEVVKLLLNLTPSAAEEINSHGFTAIYLAAGSGHADVVAVLAAAWPDGVRMRANDALAPLGIAASKGHLEVVKTLLRVAPASVRDLDSTGAAAIHLAAQDGHTDVVAVLAAEWPDSVRKKENNGYTPLVIAAYQGHLNVVKELLKAAPDAKGDIPFAKTYAEQNGHIDVVAFLSTLSKPKTGVKKVPRHKR